MSASDSTSIRGSADPAPHPGTISEQLLRDLRCPELRMPLAIADAALVGRINRKIAAGSLRNAGGALIDRPIDGGLVRKDGQVLYPILDGIPVLLIDDRIPIDGTA